MKKLNLSGQLLVLFSCILFLTSIAFSIITLLTENKLAEEQVHSILSNDSYVIDFMLSGDTNDDTESGDTTPVLTPGIVEPDTKNSEKTFSGPNGNEFDLKIGYYVIRDGAVVSQSVLESEGKSESTTIELSSEKLTSLVTEIQEKYGNEMFRSPIQDSTTIDNEKVYYVCRFQGSTSNYTIVYTNSSFVSEQVKERSIPLIMIFLIMIVVSIFMISIWSNRYIKRVRTLQLHIEELPKKKYEETYIDNSEDEIGQLSQSVEIMRKEINENEHTKQEMLQNLSHDFKTPIAVIKSYAEAIQDGVESTDSLNLIIAQADLLNSKVIKLLQYNSIEYLDRSKPFEDINMHDIVENVVMKHKHQSDINFNLDLDDNVIFKGYAENWDIVVSNIVENALRYAVTEIKIVLREGRLRIYNDGDHIDEKFIDNVFKPYEKGSKGQFGLGMSIVEKTCIFFDYKLSVKNEDPKGVSFIIESPDRIESNSK